MATAAALERSSEDVGETPLENPSGENRIRADEAARERRAAKGKGRMTETPREEPEPVPGTARESEEREFSIYPPESANDDEREEKRVADVRQLLWSEIPAHLSFGDAESQGVVPRGEAATRKGPHLLLFLHRATVSAFDQRHRTHFDLVPSSLDESAGQQRRLGRGAWAGEGSREGPEGPGDEYRHTGNERGEL